MARPFPASVIPKSSLGRLPTTKSLQATIHRDLSYNLRNYGVGSGRNLNRKGGAVQITLHIDDHGLRRRMAIGPAEVARMWKRDMQQVAKVAFASHIKRRTPVRSELRSDYAFRKVGGKTRIRDRKSLKTGSRGKLLRTLNFRGTLEFMRITMGGKRTPYAAIIELGSIPHFTTWRRESVGNRFGASGLFSAIQTVTELEGPGGRTRQAGGGYHPGFKGFHMLERGVHDGWHVWVNKYEQYNRQFVVWLARGDFGVEGARMLSTGRYITTTGKSTTRILKSGHIQTASSRVTRIVR